MDLLLIKINIWLLVVVCAQSQKVYLLCDARDIADVAVLYWSWQVYGCDNVLLLPYGM